MSHGRRFDDEPKLNKKKVAATIIALLVIIMVIASIILAINNKSKNQNQIEMPPEYFSAYTNSAWTVINNKGEQLSNVTSDEMIIVPNKSAEVFILTYDVNFDKTIYSTKAVNSKGEQLFGNCENVNAIMNYDTVDNVWYDSEVLTFQRDGKYGLIDFSGNEVLSPEYESITALKGILKNVVIKKDGKVGLFNTTSKSVIVNPEYTTIKALGTTYNDGYIVENNEKKYGIIDSNGGIILEPKYDEILDVFGSGKYVVKENKKLTVVSDDGTLSLKSGFDKVLSINADNLVIEKGGKCGIITTDGIEIIKPQYDSMVYSFADYYIVSSKNKYGVVNSMNEVAIELKYKGIDYRSDIASLVCENSDYTTDIYTRDLQYVVTGTISKVDTDNGYIRMRIGEDYKYYNLQYQEISSQEALKDNTLFLVKENGKYGYVNKNNEKVVDCIYDDAKEQNKYGFCAVKKDGKWGALQSNGSVIQEPNIEMENNLNIDFIGTWYFAENAELNAYTK